VKLFGRRKQPTALEILSSATWTCNSCSDQHEGMFDLMAFAPEHWLKDEVYEPNSALRLDGDFLSEDFCVLGGKYFFVRGVLEIPVHGVAEKFGLGAWSTLSRVNFERYIEAFDSGSHSDLGPWGGWFGNWFKPFEDSRNQPCLVHPQLRRQRPVFTLEDDEHELARAQLEGITPDRLLEIYAVNGHVPADRAV